MPARTQTWDCSASAGFPAVLTFPSLIFFFFSAFLGVLRANLGQQRVFFTAAAQNCQGVKDFWTEEPSPAAGSCSVRQRGARGGSSKR